MSFVDCEKYIKNVLAPLCKVFANLELYYKSIDIMKRWQFSFYDSLIIAAAIQADCNVLFSEDLQHQQKIHSLTIINPFI